MNGKNRTILALLIAVVMVAAVFAGFGMNFFRATPSVDLPAITGGGDPAGETADPGQLGDYVRVDVTADTVQSVIVTLNRPESYSRAVTVETYGAGGTQGVTTAQVLTDGGWTFVSAQLPSGETEHTLVGEGRLYIWREGDSVWKDYPADSLSADLAQRIPTYEDVLAVERSSITDTGYEYKGGLECVFVEVRQEELGYLERYWVAVDTGLLVAAETLKDETVVYRMTSYEVVVPAPLGTQFTLPDGTVLHTTGG